MTIIEIKEPNHMALDRICINMREMDKIEIYGQRAHENPLMLSHEVYHVMIEQGSGRIAWLNGVPVLAAGVGEMWPNVWHVYMFGTDECRRALPAMTRWLKQRMIELYRCGVHRIACESHEDHHTAHDYLLGMGARKECVMPKYGKDGASYIRFVWLDEDAHLWIDDAIKEAA